MKLVPGVHWTRFFACPAVILPINIKLLRYPLRLCWLISTFMQEWISMNCWISHKAIGENTMMMLLWWLYHLKEEFGSPQGNTFETTSNPRNVSTLDIAASLGFWSSSWANCQQIGCSNSDPLFMGTWGYFWLSSWGYQYGKPHMTNCWIINKTPNAWKYRF